MGQIRILNKSVAERIAAGEVVERPASVVKELVENSLDADATQVVIEIEGAGSTLIRVGDNGRGMDPTDLRLSIQRFATSKISSLEELETAASFGFRGEALPSIAAVSHLEISSAAVGAVEGSRLRTAGGAEVSEETVGIPPGTAVTVRQLFFNTPARRKFLKSPSREFALIIDAVNRLALAHPHVAFRLVHEGEEVIRYPAGRQEDRIAAVLGATAFDRMQPFNETVDDVAIWGWLGKPDLARAVRRHQFVFINRRSVQSRVIGGAVEQSFQQLVPAGRFPVFAVFMELPGRRVDVNVHPRKLEVRFDDDHQIFSAVTKAVRSALRTVSIAPAISSVAASPGTPGVPLSLGELSAFAPAAESVEVASAGRLPAMRLLGQLHGTYILAQSAEGFVVIDQHAAHERVLYERLIRERERSEGNGQVLVDPAPVTLSAVEALTLREHLEILEQVGFDLEPFGDRTVLIRRVPGIAHQHPAESLLRDLLSELAESPRTTAAQVLLERAAITTACHAAVRAGDRLGSEQMAALLSDLSQTKDPFTCFHGRPTLVTVSLPAIDRWFLRK
jgi:DNA mismatch repair protein MutL